MPDHPELARLGLVMARQIYAEGGRVALPARCAAAVSLRTGGESRSRKLTPAWLTVLADRAIHRNNESSRDG